ncbi:MAG TPA: PHP domain-containing protein, partial [Streptosporangiaceae bacterium]|nr:PHP domain-containing protein [Streptosporangiaceae bacterium]
MTWTGDFVHLHVASSYSMRYGLASPAALVARARELGMPALAVTDRDGLYGAVKHAQACGEAEIAPILGADLALRNTPARPGQRPARAGRAPRREAGDPKVVRPGGAADDPGAAWLGGAAGGRAAGWPGGAAGGRAAAWLGGAAG